MPLIIHAPLSAPIISKIIIAVATPDILFVIASS